MTEIVWTAVDDARLVIPGPAETTVPLAPGWLVEAGGSGYWLPADRWTCEYHSRRIGPRVLDCRSRVDPDQRLVVDLDAARATVTALTVDALSLRVETLR